MSPLLVTGAKGRLGSALYQYFSSKGEDVVGISREEADLAQKDSLVKLMKMVKPRAILHAAAMTDVDKCELNPEQAYRDNYLATLNLADISHEMKARLVAFSTDYVFDGVKPSPYVEDDLPNPVNVYGRTKLDAEDAVKSVLTDYLIIRVSWLFGGKGDFVSFVRNTVSEGKVLKLVSDHRGCPSYISDLLPALELLLTSGAIGVYHLTNSGYCTRYQMGQEILRLIGSDAIPREATSEEVGFVAKRPKQSVLSCVKYEKMSSEPIRTWQEALYAYVKNTGKG